MFLAIGVLLLCFVYFLRKKTKQNKTKQNQKKENCIIFSDTTCTKKQTKKRQCVAESEPIYHL